MYLYFELLDLSLEFLPNMDQSDTSTDGQFFDALRMGMHAEAGSGVDRCLDFVQRYVCIFVLLGAAGRRSDAGIVVSSDSHT